ncbi:polygalacturonase-like [Wolffia australiana]
MTMHASLLVLAFMLQLGRGWSHNKMDYNFTGSSGNTWRRTIQSIPTGEIMVDDFGARGDGSTDDTKAFVAAWNAACASSAPVTMRVPVGKTYLLRPIIFSGPCKSSIYVAIEGTILASARISDWNGTDRRLWMLFDKVAGLSVQGGGTIDGNGQVWWKLSCKVDSNQPCTNAPTALTFRACDRLSVSNLKFRNSQKMQVTFSKCAGVQISGLTISAPDESPNTDGIHISGSTNVKISNCVIRTGDDCISIVSGSRFVTVTNIVCGPGHGISIGSLGVNGAEHTVSDVLVDTARLEGSTNGVRIKTWQGGKGYARNIIFRNIVMDNVKNPIIIDQNYCDSKKPCGEQKSAVAVSGVTYQNIKGTSETPVAMDFDCSSSVPCRGITLQNVNLVTKSGAVAKSFCRNVELTKYGTVVPSTCTS